MSKLSLSVTLLTAFIAASVAPGEARAESRRIAVVAQGGLERQPLALAAAATGREPYLLKTPDGACLDDRAATALLARSAATEMVIGCAVVTAGTTMVMVRRLHPAGVERRAGVVDGAGTPQELARITNALAAQVMGARAAAAAPAIPAATPSSTPPAPAAPSPAPAAPPPAPAAPSPAPAAPSPVPAALPPAPAAPPPAPAAPPPAPAAPPSAPAAPSSALSPTAAALPPTAAPAVALPGVAAAAPVAPAAAPEPTTAAAPPAPRAAVADATRPADTTPSPSPPPSLPPTSAPAATLSVAATPARQPAATAYNAVVLFAGSNGFGYGAGYRGQWRLGGGAAVLAGVDANLAVGLDIGLATRDAGPSASIVLAPTALTLKAVRSFGEVTAAARAGLAGVFAYTAVDPAWSLDLTVLGVAGAEARYGRWLGALDILAGKGTVALLSAGIAF